MKSVASLLLLLFTIFSFNANANSETVLIQHLRIEARSNPFGVDAANPRFSWQLQSESKNVIQFYYQIIVADDPQKLDRNSGLTWNSGQIKSDASQFIPYNGRVLQQGKIYYWKVKVWTNKGESEWSPIAHWSVAYGAQSFSKAIWIGLDSTMKSGKLTTKTRLSARYLRKEFRVEKEIKNALLYISGLGIYKCYINGKQVNQDIFSPTASDYSKRVYYNVLDVKEFLDSGTNTIGVVLGNGRFFSMRMENIPGGEPLDVSPIQHYGFPKLILQLELEYTRGSRESIVSDTSWKITADGPILSNNEYDGEEYDARLEMPGWNKNTYADGHWLMAKKVAAPAGRLEAQPNPNLATMREIKPRRVFEMEKGRYIVDMGQNMVGWVLFKLAGIAGKPIVFRYAETLQKNGNLYTANLRGARNTDIYIPAGSSEFEWEPSFVYHGFRYVEISGIDFLPEVNDLTGKVNYDSMANSGTFLTSDTVINQVYNNAVWGIMGNYRSMPTDCPQRDERMGWLGDRAIGSYGESFIFDNQLLYAKWAKDIQDTQFENGSIADVAPAYWAFYTDNVTWPSAFFHIVNMLHEQFGDDKPIKLHYASMKKWIRYMQANYMKEFIMTKDQYGDWCMPPEDINIIFSKDSSRITDGEILSTSFFYKLLLIMSKNAVVSGNLKDQQEFLNLAENVKTAYNAKFFNKENARYGNNTVTANIISLMQGLVPNGYEEKVFDNIVNRIEGEFNSHVSVGLIGIQFLMRGLSTYGRSDLAYKLATNKTYPSWGYMVENGATTIWELWNGNTADPAMNSGNHLMLLGDLLTWYYENLAGIKTDTVEVGFKKIRLQPVFPAGLSYVKASHNSPYGLIKSEWELSRHELKWNILIPANTSAVVYFPSRTVSGISENGLPVRSGSKGIKFIDDKGDYVIVHIGSGKYEFNVSDPEFAIDR